MTVKSRTTESDSNTKEQRRAYDILLATAAPPLHCDLLVDSAAGSHTNVRRCGGAGRRTEVGNPCGEAATASATQKRCRCMRLGLVAGSYVEELRMLQPDIQLVRQTILNETNLGRLSF